MNIRYYLILFILLFISCSSIDTVEKQVVNNEENTPKDEVALEGEDARLSLYPDLKLIETHSLPTYKIPGNELGKWVMDNFDLVFGDRNIENDDFIIECKYFYEEQTSFNLNHKKGDRKRSYVPEGEITLSDKFCINDTKNIVTNFGGWCLANLPSGLFNRMLYTKINDDKIHFIGKVSGFHWNSNLPDKASDYYSVVEYNINRKNGNILQTLSTVKKDKENNWESEPRYGSTVYFGKCKKVLNSKENKLWTYFKSITSYSYDKTKNFYPPVSLF